MEEVGREGWTASWGGMVELYLVGPGTLLPRLMGFHAISPGISDKRDSLPRRFASAATSSCVVMRGSFPPIPTAGCLPLPVVWHAPKFTVSRVEISQNVIISKQTQQFGTNERCLKPICLYLHVASSKVNVWHISYVIPY